MGERLDRLVRPTVRLCGRERSSFRACGLVGLAAALATCAAVLTARDVALWALPLLGATGVATFLALAFAVKVASGRESLVYYHHEIAILLACSLAASAAGLPVLASLDAAVLGVGAFLACGRVGCLLVGCCHGRPARHGVRYGPAHAAAGFPADLVGVRLAPVQAIEAVVAASITACGLIAVAAGARPGVPLVLYVCAYGVARFALEEWRGDTGRRRLLGFSEAQWTSLGLTAFFAVSGPAPRWLATATAAGLALAMAAMAWRRRHATRPRAASPDSVAAIAQALHRLDAGGDRLVVDAGDGVRLSGGARDGSGHIHYGLSGASFAKLRDVAAVVVALRHRDRAESAQLVEGGGGVLHLLLPDESTAISSAARPSHPRRACAR